MAVKKFAPRPDSVLVGHMTYSIQYLSDDEWSDERYPDFAGGVTLSAQSAICIRVTPKSSEAYLRSNLVHEILHACWYIGGVDNQINSADDKEEYSINTIAPLVLFVMQQNPEVMAYLMSQEHHD